MANMKWTDDIDNLVKSMAEAGSTVSEISEAVGCKITSIRTRASHLGVKITRSNNVEVNKDFFTTPSRDLYYFLGMVLTDGHISKDGRRLIITQSYDHGLEMLETIKSKAGGSIRKMTDVAYQYHICKPDVISIVEKMGVPRSKKSLILKLPEVPISYLWDFIRGISDGDGYVSIQTRKNGCSLLLWGVTSGSPLFLQALQKILEESVGVASTHISTRGNTGELRYGSHDSMKILDKIYENLDGQIYLRTKYENYRMFKSGVERNA